MLKKLFSLFFFFFKDFLVISNEHNLPWVLLKKITSVFCLKQRVVAIIHFILKEEVKRGPGFISFNVNHIYSSYILS